MHLKDLRKGAKGKLSEGTAVETDVAFGTEQLDIPSILKATKKAGIMRYYTEDESQSYHKQVSQTMLYLKNISI